jgi:hypothetical protein
MDWPAKVTCSAMRHAAHVKLLKHFLGDICVLKVSILAEVFPHLEAL